MIVSYHIAGILSTLLPKEKEETILETRPEKTYKVQNVRIEKVPAEVFREEVVYDYWLEVYLTPLFADRHRRFRVSLFSIVNPDGTHCPLGVDAIEPRTILKLMEGKTQKYDRTCFIIKISEPQFEMLSRDAKLHFVVEDLSGATPNRHTELIQMQNGHMSGL